MPATIIHHLLLSSETRPAKISEPAAPSFTSPVRTSSPADLLNPAAQMESVTSEIRRFIQQQFTRLREQEL